MLNRHNSIGVVSTLIWNNVDKYTSAQLSFSTKFQGWNSVDQRQRFKVDVFAGKEPILHFSQETVKVL